MSSQQSSQINNQQQQNYLQQRRQQLLQGLIIPRSIQELNKFDQRKFGVTISSGFIGPIKNNKYLESQHFMFYINLLNHVYKNKRILAFDFYVFCDFMPNLVKETMQYSQKQKEQLQLNQRRLETNRNIQIIQQTIENNSNFMEQFKERIDYNQQELATLMSTNEENHIDPSKQEFYSVWGNKDDVSTVKSSKSQIVIASQQEQNQKTHSQSQVIKSEEQSKKNIIITSIHQSETNLSQAKDPDNLLKARIITGQTDHQLNQSQVEQGQSEPIGDMEVEKENQTVDTNQQSQYQSQQKDESQAPSQTTINSELKINSEINSQTQEQNESQQNIPIQIDKIDEEIKKENDKAARQWQQNQIQQQIAELQQKLQTMQNENIDNQAILPMFQQELFNIAEQLKRIQQEIYYLSYDQKKLNEAMKDTMREFRYSNKDEFLKNSDKFYFPINLNNNHWISIVVDTVRGRIFYLDSLSRNYRQDIIQGLYQIFQNYLDLDISQYKIESDCPQQQNAYDCGIFALLALLYTYQSSRPKPCEMKDIYQYSQTLVNEYRKRVLIDIAIIASQKNEFSSSDLEFIIENEL